MSDKQLLAPAKPLFIWGSLSGAFALAMLFNFSLWGRAPWHPDLLALALAFWSVHQPRRVGMGGAFLFGLLMDVHQGSVLGQHALAYSVLSFLAISVHRRLLWFSAPGQALQILPVLAAAHAVSLAVGLMAGGQFPGWSLLIAPVIEAALWPLATLLLLLPQHRARNASLNRNL